MSQRGPSVASELSKPDDRRPLRPWLWATTLIVLVCAGWKLGDVITPPAIAVPAVKMPTLFAEAPQKPQRYVKPRPVRSPKYPGSPAYGEKPVSAESHGYVTVAPPPNTPETDIRKTTR